MHNVFVKKSAEELQVELSDGRLMPLKDLVGDYERLLKEESQKKETVSEPKGEKVVTSELRVGEWFRIDREVINKSKEKIRLKCSEVGYEGEVCWQRFQKSNEIADKNPEEYPRLIETYVFEKIWECKTEPEMQNVCKAKGEGMCDEIICDLELQMRICNGESATDLFKKADKLPCMRIIKLRNGGNSCFGGGAGNNIDFPPASHTPCFFFPNSKIYKCTPYAFRRVLS